MKKGINENKWTNYSIFKTINVWLRFLERRNVEFGHAVRIMHTKVEQGNITMEQELNLRINRLFSASDKPM